MATTACQQTGPVSAGLLAHLAWVPDTELVISMPELRGLAQEQSLFVQSAFRSCQPVSQAGIAAGSDLEAAAPQRRLGGVHGWDQHGDQQGHMQGGCLQALLAVQHLRPPQAQRQAWCNLPAQPLPPDRCVVAGGPCWLPEAPWAVLGAKPCQACCTQSRTGQGCGMQPSPEAGPDTAAHSWPLPPDRPAPACTRTPVIGQGLCVLLAELQHVAPGAGDGLHRL